MPCAYTFKITLNFLSHQLVINMNSFLPWMDIPVCLLLPEELSVDSGLGFSHILPVEFSHLEHGIHNNEHYLMGHTPINTHLHAHRYIVCLVMCKSLEQLFISLHFASKQLSL